MSISGNLKTMELSEALQWLSNGAKTGTLVLARGDLEKKIFFKQGKVIATSSSEPLEHLGHFLVARGLIDEATLAKAMAMQVESKMLIGKILVTLGAISEKDLDEMLRLKSEETIYEIFTWTEGSFRFIDGELPKFAMVPLRIRLTAVTLEGVRRADESARLRKTMPSTEVVAVAVGMLEAPTDDPVAAQILGAVNDDRTLEEIILHSHTNDYHVRRVISEQVERGKIKLIRPRVVTGEGVPTNGDGPGTAAVDLAAMAGSLLDSGKYAAALRHFRAALSLSPADPELKSKTERAEEEVKEALAAEGISPTMTPRLAIAVEDLMNLDLTPEEGFLLTRIDGNYNIETLLKISPMPALDVMLVMRGLRQAGHIKLDS